jgi:3-hydroxyisobutyrate dehydrogenase-like beta-hydroxyacid dehydrogenase
MVRQRDRWHFCNFNRNESNMGKKIGFVGLGTMGLPMAVNLNKAGVKVAATLKEVAEQADDAIVSMVRDHAQNVEIILGEGGLMSAKPRGLTIIVMSTLDPDSMNELGRQVEAAGDVKLIAAAVSGGATGAQAGTLSIMASGPQDRVDARVRILMPSAPTPSTTAPSPATARPPSWSTTWCWASS